MKKITRHEREACNLHGELIIGEPFTIAGMLHKVERDGRVYIKPSYVWVSSTKTIADVNKYVRNLEFI